jgi:hypothetical protein
MGERYRDTRHQSNGCSAELLDQSSPALIATERVFPGQELKSEVFTFRPDLRRRGAGGGLTTG